VTVPGAVEIPFAIMTYCEFAKGKRKNGQMHLLRWVA
jgi:hypothetical protein